MKDQWVLLYKPQHCEMIATERKKVELLTTYVEYDLLQGFQYKI